MSLLPSIALVCLAGCAPVLWDCPKNLRASAHQTFKAHGIAKLSAYLPRGEAADQSDRYPSRQCPEQALAAAVTALVESTNRESLTQLSSALCDVRCLLNRPSSMIGIVADDGSALSNQLLPLPPGRTSVLSDWTFFLSVPDLSEHGFWALVPRGGGAVTTISMN